MKKETEHINDKLLRYIDGQMNEVDRAEMATLLKNDPELQERLMWLRKTDQILRDRTPETPSVNFTANVINNLDQFPVRTGMSPLKGLLLLTGVMLTVGIAVLLVYAGAFDAMATINVNNPAYSDVFKQSLPSIPFNGKLVVNVIIVLNLIIAFIVLDRTILRPWFQHRTKMHF